MKKVLFTAFKFLKEQEEILKKNGVQVKYAVGDLDEKHLNQELQGCDIYIIGGSDRATKLVIENSNLELIVFYGTGYENYIDLETTKKRNIKTAYTPGANSYTVAEHTVALILDAVKQITFLNNTTKKGEWNRREAWNLENKTLGVIGLGSIGGHVARIMNKGFVMKILYFGRTRRVDLEKELDAKKVDLKTLMSSSDVVTLHAPLNSETIDIIGKTEMKYMKKHAVLVNCARAGLVEPKALKISLEEGVFATAAFDVYYKEPAPVKTKDDWGLLSLPDNKFILTPHTAYGSKEAVENMNNMVVENIVSYLKTGIPKYEIK